MDGVVLELQSNLQDLYSRLPSMEEIINFHFSGRNYRMLDDEHSSKTFLKLECAKSSYNNVSRLQIEDDEIDETKKTS